MKKGLAPQKFNPERGRMESMELHHTPPQREGGGLILKKCGQKSTQQRIHIDVPEIKINMSFEKSFIESEGKPIIFNGKEIILIDRISIGKVQRVKVEFIETNSDWKQGVILKTKGDFIFDNGEVVSFRPVLWEDTAPNQIDIQIKSKNRELIVYNVWDVGNGTMHYCHNGAAMEVKIDGNIRTYYCNDGYPDTDFNDLIFKIELLDS